MKKSIFKLAAVAALALSSFMVAGSASANTNADSNVVFYIPHQDDEVLTFGVGILNHVQNGHNVHVVLLTDGAGSRVRTELGMEREEFSAARDREFAYALSILGVKPENIHYENYPDGHMTVDQAKQPILRFEKLYPNAKHKVYSDLDMHTDHYNSGKALRQLLNAGVVTDARFYLRRGHNPTDVRITTESKKAHYDSILVAAAVPYQMVNTNLGFYGIGYMSVTNSFDQHVINPISRYHK